MYQKMNRKWKAIRGWWDGSAKNDGRCGCGIVIKKGPTQTDGSLSVKSPCHLEKECSSVAAEIVGGGYLTEVADFFCESKFDSENH